MFNSSKTREEILALQHAMHVEGPFVSENGSALYLPPEAGNGAPADGLRRVLFGRARRDILTVLHTLRVRHGWKFEGFADWSVAQIMTHTGLDREAAGRASRREYSEPLQWKDSDSALQAFSSSLEQAGLALLKGGRFYSVQGQTDKGKALLWLREHYTMQNEAAPKLICLGDSDNDRQMLDVADYPVWVKSPVAPFPRLPSGRKAMHTRAEGPAGWTEAVMQLLSESN